MKKRFLALVVTTAMTTLPTAADAPFGAVTTPGYIPDTAVTVAVADGGRVLVPDPAITIAVERVTASPSAKLDQTTNHIILVKQGSAMMVTEGTLSNGTITSGRNRNLKEGDLIVIPAKTPYQWKETPAGSATILAIHKETPKSGDTWGIPDVVQVIAAERIKTRMTTPGGARDPLIWDPGVVFYAQRVSGVEGDDEVHPHHSHIFLLMDGEARFMTGEPGKAV